MNKTGQNASELANLGEAWVSVFRSATDAKPVKSESIEAVLAGIRDGRWKKQVQRVRDVLARDGEEAYKNAKKALPAVTFAGEFSKRANGALVRHSGYICLDIDSLDIEELDEVRKKVWADPYTVWVFVSPSGAGLKVGIRVPVAKDADEHRGYFEAIDAYYRDVLGVTLDQAGKDVARLCFVSWDPSILARVNAADFGEEIERGKVLAAAASTPSTSSGTGSVIDEYNRRHSIEELLERHGYTRKGNRYVRPGGSSPSVQVSDGKSFHHSSNDPLHGPHLIDPFDVYVAYEHGGSLTDAVREAADLLGMRGAGARKKSMGAGNGNGNGNGKSNGGPPASSKEADQDNEPRRAGRGAFGEYNLTDLGNALRLIDKYGGFLRYNKVPFGSWLWWNGKYWQFDKTNKIFEFGIKVIDDIHLEIPKLDDPNERKKLAGWAFQLESLKRQNSMISMAANDQRIVISVDDLDSNPWLLNVQNGTLDLENGEVVFREHLPGDYLTRALEVNYNPDAKCPQWQCFLDRIFNSDHEMLQFIQRAVGHSLTGDISGQYLFFAYGVGANGKSVFFNTMEILFGDYFYRAPAEMVLQQKNAQIPADVANLKGKRFVVTSELEENRRLAEARVKSLTGNDTIEARKLYGDWFTFKPSHKLWMYGNHEPIITGTDHGIWRRIRKLPFSVIIPDQEQISMEEMLLKFRKELPGILNWALEGYVRYRECGLNQPEAIIRANAEYRDAMDQVGQFIQQCCLLNPSLEENGKAVWQNYHGWCDDQGERAMGGRRFYSKLRERGLDVRPGTDNKTIIRGLGLLSGREEKLGSN